MAIVVLLNMMMGKAEKSVVTANVTSHGPMMEWLATQPGSQITCVQGHHADVIKLAEIQSKAEDLGWKGMLAPATATSNGQGTTGGVAILAPSHITIAAPPGLPHQVLREGRIVAAQLHWGVPG